MDNVRKLTKDELYGLEYIRKLQQKINSLQKQLDIAVECINIWISQGSINHMGKTVSGEEIGNQYKRKIKAMKYEE